MRTPGPRGPGPLLPLAFLLGAAGPVQESSREGDVGLRRHAAEAFPGLTLVSPLDSTRVYLLDLEGRPVHTWETGTTPGGGLVLLDDGSLLRLARVPDNPRFEGGGLAGRLQRFGWDGELLWDWVLANEYQTTHHDLEPLPNGNVLVVVWEYRYPEDVVAAGRDPAAVDERGLWPDAVLEVRPRPPEGAEVVWEWRVWDHLIQDFDPDEEGYGSIPDHPERIDINADHRRVPPENEAERRAREELEARMRALGYVGGGEDAPPAAPPDPGHAPDWLHTNAVAYCAELDLIALSVPHFNEVWIIDHSLSTEQAAWNDGGRFGKGGGLLWRWGNPAAWGAGSEEDRQLSYQHDPSWILTPEGPHLLVFDNGRGREASRVVELELPFDPERGFLREPRAPYPPAAPVWTYEAPDFYAPFISGAQRLPNGNTLICEGPEGRVFEVTHDGRIVWEWINDIEGNVPQGEGQPAPAGALFRATRIGFDDPALARLKASER